MRTVVAVQNPPFHSLIDLAEGSIHALIHRGLSLLSRFILVGAAS